MSPSIRESTLTWLDASNSCSCRVPVSVETKVWSTGKLQGKTHCHCDVPEGETHTVKVTPGDSMSHETTDPLTRSSRMQDRFKPPLARAGSNPPSLGQVQPCLPPPRADSKSYN